MAKDIKSSDMELIVNYGEPNQQKVKGLETINMPDFPQTESMSVKEFRDNFAKKFLSEPVTFEGTFNADCSILKEFICPGKPEDYENEISFHIISITKNKKDVEIMTNMEGTGLQLVIFHEPNDMFINAFCRAMWDKEPFVLCF